MEVPYPVGTVVQLDGLMIEDGKFFMKFIMVANYFLIIVYTVL